MIEGALLGALAGEVLWDTCKEVLKHQRSGLLHKVGQSLRSRYTQGTLPANHNLEKAMYESLSHAARFLAYSIHDPEFCPMAGLLARGKVNEFGHRLAEMVQNNIVPETATDYWLQALIDASKDLDNFKDFSLKLVFDSKLTTLVADRLQPELCQHVQMEFLKWCERHVNNPNQPGRFTKLQKPPCFDQYVRDGWTLRDCGRKITFYEVFCLFFREHLKQNQVVFKAFTAATLAEIQADVQQSATDAAAAKGELGRIKAQLYNFQEFQRSMDRQNRSALNALQHIKSRVESLHQKTSGIQSDIQDIKVLLERAVPKVPGFYEISARFDAILKDYRERRIFGREQALRSIDEFLAAPQGFLLVTAKSGYGKTALMAYLLDHPPKGFVVFRHIFRTSSRETRSLKTFYRHFIACLRRHRGSNEGVPSSALPEDELRDEVFRAIDQLHETPQKKGPRILFIIDGLDEAERDFDPPFPSELPAGLHIIVSARSGTGGRGEKYLRPWLELNPARLQLDALTPSAIKAWLEAEPDDRLSSLGNNPECVAQLHDRTEGCPIFLKELFEDLGQAANPATAWRTILELTPRGFAQYVHQQFDELAKVASVETITLFELLSVAEIGLDETDIRTLIPGINLAQLPWQAERWLTRSSVPGHGERWEFSLPPVKEVLAAKVASSAAEDKLVAFCRDWWTHRSRYALRYYGLHLARRKEWREVHHLFSNHAFVQILAREFADDPDLCLAMVQELFTTAAGTDDVAGMAEALLLHVTLTDGLARPRELRNQPIEAVCRHFSAISERVSPALGALWNLILSYELQRQGRADEARKQIDQLRHLDLTALSGIRADIAAVLISRLVDPKDSLLIQMADRLLDDDAKQRLILCLMQKHDAGATLAARRVFRLLPPTKANVISRQHDWSLEIIVTELARSGDWEQAIRQVNRPTLPQLEAQLAFALGEEALEAKRHDILERLIAFVADRAKASKHGRDRLRLRGTQARLGALLAKLRMLANDEPAARLCLQDAATLASSLNVSKKRTRAELFAFVTFAEVAVSTGLGVLSKREMAYPPKHPARKWLAKAVRCWRSMQRQVRDEQGDARSTDAAVANDLLTILKAYAALAETFSTTRPRLSRWLKESERQLRFLSKSDRDIIWYRLARFHLSREKVMVGNVLRCIGRISDSVRQGRTAAMLVERLHKDGNLKEAEELARGSRYIASALWGSIGLCKLDTDPSAAVTALTLAARLRDTAPTRRQSIQGIVLWAEVGAALRAAGSGLCRRYFTAAMMRADELRPGTAIRCRFFLNIAEAAFTANEPYRP